MKYYINKNKEIFGFQLDGSQDGLITKGMKPITLEEIQAINQAKEDEYKETIEYKIQEAQQYLNSTDWMYARKAETGIEVPEEVQVKRAESRKFIQDNKGAK